MEDVQVSVIGGTSSGGLKNGTLGETPEGQPDARFNVVPPLIAIGVRFAHVFLTSFVGVLTVAGIGGSDLITATDFAGVLKTGVWMALSVSGMNFLKDLLTIFGRLEGRYPLISGSI